MSESFFYVHIVESPSPDDLLDGRTQGNTLCSFLQIAGIPCQYNLVVNRRLLEIALTNRIAEAAVALNKKPIIHFGAHGNDKGLQLTDQRDSQTIVPWAELRNLLLPIHQAVNGVGVCMSSCGGLFGKKMAEVAKPDQVPMSWVVGSEKTIHYPDAALAFAVFYRGLCRGMSESDLITAMRAASGVPDFKVEYGHMVQQSYAKITAAAIKILELLKKQ